MNKKLSIYSSVRLCWLSTVCYKFVIAMRLSLAYTSLDYIAYTLIKFTQYFMFLYWRSISHPWPILNHCQTCCQNTWNYKWSPKTSKQCTIIQLGMLKCRFNGKIYQTLKLLGNLLMPLSLFHPEDKVKFLGGILLLSLLLVMRMLEACPS